MNLFLAAEDSESELRSEIAALFPSAVVNQPRPMLVEVAPPENAGLSLPRIVFARQCLPNVRRVHAETIGAWAHELLFSLLGALPEGQPWRLHIEPYYGARAQSRIGARAWHSAKRASTFEKRPRNQESFIADHRAGAQRCRLIRAELFDLLRKKRRWLLKSLGEDPTPFTPETSLVQLLLVSPSQGYLSVAVAPMPWEQRHVISPLPKGYLQPASDPSAPSRAFAKLAEAQVRMGWFIQPGETCVDLGAAPGSWTYLALSRGARVVAVDRSPLRPDLMTNPRVRFQASDAFQFKPGATVDWLLCDVIAQPERSAELLLSWLRQGWCRNFVVTFKLKDEPGSPLVPDLKRALQQSRADWFLNRLCSNKKEICAFGMAAAPSQAPA